MTNIKKYLDLEDIKRDFTTMSRAINKQLNNLLKYKQIYKNIAWVKKFVRLVTDKKLDSPVKEVQGHLQQLNDLKFYFETISSMLQQVQNDFPASIHKRDNISRNRLIKDLKVLGQKLNSVINENLDDISSLNPTHKTNLYSKFLTSDKSIVYNMQVYINDIPYDYEVIRFFGVEIDKYKIDQLTLYIRKVNNNYQVFVLEGFSIPGFEPQDNYVSSKSPKTTIQNILISQGLLPLNTNEVKNIKSEEITFSSPSTLIIPFKVNEKDDPKRVALSIRNKIIRKLKDYKIDLKPIFKIHYYNNSFSNYSLSMDFGDVLLSDKTAIIIQNILGLSPKVLNSLLVALENNNFSEV